MKDNINLHLKVQEMCDCYAATDPLKEMSILKNDPDKHQAAVKWLALAALHGINTNANKITISKSENGSINVSANYREKDLPSPGNDVGQRIIEALKAITHIEKDNGEMPLALGIRDSSVDLVVRIDTDHGRKKVILEFAEQK